MAEQHDQILAAVGIPAEKITELNKLTPEQMKEFKLDDYIAPVNSAYETKLLNDGNFLNKIPVEKLPDSIKKSIETGQYGRFMNELKEVATKELGLEMTEFPEDVQKSLKQFFRKANELYTTKKAPDSKTLIALQQQLQDALRGKETVEGSISTKIAEALAGEKTKHSTQLEKLLTMLQLSSLDGYKLKVKPEYIVDAMLGKLKGKYSLNFDPETQGFSVNQKDHPGLKALNGSNEITFTDALLEQLQSDGLIDKIEGGGSNGEKPPVTVRVSNDGKTELPGYIADKMKTALKEETVKA